MNPFPVKPDLDLNSWETPGRTWPTQIHGVTFSRHSLRYPPHFEFHWNCSGLYLTGHGSTPELAWKSLKRLLNKYWGGEKCQKLSLNSIYQMTKTIICVRCTEAKLSRLSGMWIMSAVIFSSIPKILRRIAKSSQQKFVKCVGKLWKR